MIKRKTKQLEFVKNKEIQPLLESNQNYRVIQFQNRVVFRSKSPRAPIGSTL